MSPNPNLKAVIFDFGGVLMRTFNRTPRTYWDDKLGLDHGQFEEYIFNSDIGTQAQLGQVTWDDVWAAAAAKFGLLADECLQAQADFFKGDAIDEAFIDQIRRMKGYYTIGLLSNTWHRDGWAMLKEMNLDDAFQVTLTSAEVGLMKPDPQIYRIALERVQAKPHQILFVDDRADNIASAQTVGLQGLHFVEPEKDKRILAELVGIS